MNQPCINTDYLPVTNLIGWFAIAFSKDIKPGQAITKHFLNKNILLVRNQHGNLQSKEDMPISERNDIVYIWYHPNGIKPTWHIPILDQNGWSSFLYRELHLYTHPQEIYENSVDIAHFSNVHHFNQVSLLDLSFDKQMMSISYTLQRKRKKILGMQSTKVQFKMELYGLSSAYTHIHIPFNNMLVRMFTLATPIQTNQVTIRLATAIAFNNKNFIKKITIPCVRYFIQKNIVEDFCEDVKIWEHKRYYLNPLLVKGDGQILKFRRWSSQFYA